METKNQSPNSLEGFDELPKVLLLGKTSHGVSTFVKNFIKFNSKDQIVSVIGR